MAGRIVTSRIASAGIAPVESTMETRTLGKTGLKVSALGFGCGMVGGLMVRGAPVDQERAVARALELGINYFDTAPLYGNGESEKNLGRVLAALRPNILVGTKVRIPQAEFTRIGEAMTTSLETSLRRLGRERVDLLQLHNHISRATNADAIDPKSVLEEVVPAFERLQRQGKIRFFGITAVGDTDALHQVVDAGAISTAQIVYNLLSPSAGGRLAPGFPAHDFGNILERTKRAGIGVICIRVLAGGALSGTEARHQLASPAVQPIASGADYRADIEHARLLEPLVREGYADSLIEASLRFAIANDAVGTVLVGYSTLEQLEYAATSINKGPLSTAALRRLAELQASL
jgi:L-galactose dehydrogenase/L-glyceraldehyde 3-phosphate reductase